MVPQASASRRLQVRTCSIKHSRDCSSPEFLSLKYRERYVIEDRTTTESGITIGLRHLPAMSTKVFVQQSGPPSPPPDRATVSVHALSAGHFTLPEYQFVHPVSRDARKTVPSLAFLIQHRNDQTGKTTRIVFDLGLRRDIARYAPPIQKHVETRQPMTTLPDVVQSLGRGGLTPSDIDYVLYSHVRRMSISATISERC